MAGDYYQTLGISRDANQDEIKRAYRRLARKYHPDVNKEPGAEDKFKEVNRAHEVLSDPEVRARYDRFGEAGVSSGGAGGYSDFGDMGGFADIFETIFSGFGGGGGAAGGTQARRRNGPVRGDDLRLDLKLQFREAIFGGEKEIRIPHQESCKTCNGSGAKAVRERKLTPILKPAEPVMGRGRCAARRGLPLVVLLRCRCAQAVTVKAM